MQTMEMVSEEVPVHKGLQSGEEFEGDLGGEGGGEGGGDW